jgi:hypothetical protein
MNAEDADFIVFPRLSALISVQLLHPVRQRHGALFTDPDVQRRLRYELVERRVA